MRKIAKIHDDNYYTHSGMILVFQLTSLQYAVEISKINRRKMTSFWCLLWEDTANEKVAGTRDDSEPLGTSSGLVTQEVRI